MGVKRGRMVGLAVARFGLHEVTVAVRQEGEKGRGEWGLPSDLQSIAGMKRWR